MSIKHSLLALLSTEPMYGQQLKDEFEARTGELWPLNVGQVYTSLGRLERDGLVEGSGPATDAPTRPFSITAAGQVELDLWLKASPASKAPPRDDLIMKVMISLSIDQLGSGDVLQSHRRQILQSMQRYTHMKADPTVTVAGLMMCDAEVFRLEAMVRWIDSVEGRLRSGAQLEVPQASSTTSLKGSLVAQADSSTEISS